MKSKKGKLKKAFKQAVEDTIDVAKCYQTGLNALGKYSSKIKVLNTHHLQGSVDIDTCTLLKYPNANRWDYVFAYKGEAFFVEVHTAKTGAVRTVLNKQQWLKDWLNEHAPEINNLKATSRDTFYWIQSKNFSIPKTAPQYRQAMQNNVIPISVLNLNY